MSRGIQWWGYLHASGTLQVKRYFGPLDIQEAQESPFVNEVYGPWEVEHRVQAEMKLKEAIAARRAERSRT